MSEMISIIVPNYNGGATLPSCLDALFRLDHDDYKVIVVDDASTDDSVEIIRRYDCVLIEQEVNQGPAHARNRGADAAKGEILLFTDSDVILPKDTLRRISERFRERGDISAIVGMPDKHCAFGNVASQHFNLRVHFNYLKMPERIPIVYGSIFTVKKDAYSSINGFNTKLKDAAIEDTDLGYRLTEHGHVILLDKSIQINHYKHLSTFRLLKNDFHRGAARLKLMLRKRKLKTSIQQKRFISTPLSQIISLLTIPLFLFSAIYNRMLIAPLLLVFFYLYKDYLLFISKEKGILFALMIYALLLADMSVVSMGIVSGLVSYLGGNSY